MLLQIGYEIPNKKMAQIYKKQNMGEWKQKALMETINTSMDMDMMELCRLEFSHRLKVYHAWKRRQGMEEEGEDGEKKKKRRPPKKKKKVNTQAQGYFKKKGRGRMAGGHVWFHFDGQWIARQMELHPERDAGVYLAGRDDMDMTEESLEDTGLARKPNAQIS